MIARVVRRLRALFRSDAVDRELTAEIELHLEMEAEELVRTQGLSPEEARRRARVAFGGVARYREEQRDARGVRWIEESLADLKYAVRVLLRSPGYTIPAVLVLGLGIGATTAIFSVVSTVFGRLPYANDDELVRVYNQNSLTNRWTTSVADFQAIEGQAHTLSAVGVLSFRSVPVAAGGDPQTRWLAASLFQVSPTDPVTLGLVTLTLLVVAAVACWLPARRAATTDPVQALRSET
jgi:hypothetical protein